ncbi:MAG: hypothetical protein IH626_15455 [Rhodospirillales bacterium]|nr:hypothetical protein [Rhodospirillales bacterium]
MKTPLKLLFGLVGLAPASAIAGEPGASAWVDNGHVEVRLIAAEAPAEDGSIRLGAHFRMDDGWKIYWRSPGDAGYPPRCAE